MSAAFIGAGTVILNWSDLAHFWEATLAEFVALSISFKILPTYCVYLVDVNEIEEFHWLNKIRPLKIIQIHFELSIWYYATLKMGYKINIKVAVRKFPLVHF